MSDPFDVFKSLDRYYPGSRTVRGAARAQAAPILPEWYERPQIKRIKGQDVEMFTVGALAKALGKTVPTIRMYERNGYIPHTPYRLPSRVVAGETRKGRRLYTREMITAAVESFVERGLLDAPRIEWREYPELPQEIAEKWRSIQERLNAQRPTT